MENELFVKALAAFDEVHAQDPRKEVVDGEERPKELVYAERMSTRLAAFKPDASEALRLAARAQHLGRWKIARSEFPMDVKGYNMWRSQLKKLHADEAAAILTGLGYDPEIVSEVKDLVLKKQFKTRPDAQALEDVVCLTFLAYYFEEFAAKHEDEKVIDIVRKTWGKMSEDGHAAALKLSLPEHLGTLIGKAVNM